MEGEHGQSELYPPTSILNQENAPPRLAHRPIWRRHSLNWGSSSQVTPACIKLEKKKNHQNPNQDILDFITYANSKVTANGNLEHWNGEKLEI